MKILKTFGAEASAADAAIQQLEQRGAVNTAKVDAVVRDILSAVQDRGDAAVREFATNFDGLADDQPLLVSRAEMQAAWDSHQRRTEGCVCGLHRQTSELFAEKQLPHAWSFRPVEGMEVGQIVRPLGSVGCYVPGGRYPLPSTLLMTVTPAQVAGVERIVVCSPKPARETMAAAYLCGVTRVLSHRWSSSDCCIGLWHGDGGGGRQDRRSRQSLRDRRKDGRVSSYGR